MIINLPTICVGVVLCIIFFVIGFARGHNVKADKPTDGVMIIDEKMGIASISWTKDYDEVVSSETLTFTVTHKNA